MVTFTINGNVVSVDENVPIGTSLNTFIRKHQYLTGTKYMCNGGVCGSCMVNVKYTHPVTKKKITISANSCLMLVHSCHGMVITTIEGVNGTGTGKKVGDALVKYSGTQCGFCSPGFVVSMYSLLDKNPKVTSEEVESLIGSNICRCTGFRPILDAFKSLSSNPPANLSKNVCDIEDCDLTECKSCCKTNCEECLEDFSLDLLEISLASRNLELESGNKKWYKVSTLKEIFEVFDANANKEYVLVNGHTYTGVIKPSPEVNIYIDISGVNELKKISLESKGLTIGAGVTITEILEALETYSSQEGFEYFKKLSQHWKKIANLPIRNRGTIGGNLYMAVKWRYYISDIFVALEAFSARISVVNSNESFSLKAMNLYEMDLKKKVIKSITLPKYAREYHYDSYKVGQASVSSLAVVNAAFLMKVRDGKIVEKPSIVFSGLTHNVVHAKKTETFLNGSTLASRESFKKSVELLSAELKTEGTRSLFSGEYRRRTAIGLFYRMYLNLLGDKVDGKFKSGREELFRPLSSGKQIFSTDEKEYPVSQPIPKVEARSQISGDAIYTMDHPVLPQELYCCLVVSTELADIISIDASPALKINGVEAFYSAKDIPGENDINEMFKLYGTNIRQELFVSRTVHFVGEPIGVVVAKTHELALKASKMVKVSYNNPRKPLTTVREVLASPEKDKRSFLMSSIKPTEQALEDDVFKTITGELDCGAQYAMPIEGQSSIVRPNEDGQLNIISSLQWAQGSAQGVSFVTKIPLNKIDMHVTRVGGSFGCKAYAGQSTLCACAVAAVNLNKPCRLEPNVETDIGNNGQRPPFYFKYEVKVTKEGKILSLKAELYSDVGLVKAANIFNSFIFPSGTPNIYDTSTWDVKFYSVETDCPAYLFVRSVGNKDAIALSEVIMDHIAHELQLEAIDVRLMNSKDDIAKKYISDWRTSTDYDKRKDEINKYNMENRWKKKGISLSVMKYNIGFVFRRIGATVTIVWPDGTVIVEHGGIEMGQGINTKVAVVVAHALGVPLDSVKVKPTRSVSFPNNDHSTGSLTSDLAAYAAQICCDVLNERLKPAKEKFKDDWKMVVNEALRSGVDLTSSLPNNIQDKSSGLKDYIVHGVLVSEVEVDLLTGSREMLRVDLLEDVGQSLSPLVDIGQVEGAFILGVGHIINERTVYDNKTGKNLTTDIVEYMAPRAQDIPLDFRVTFVENSTNPNGILNSKATGEPATTLSVGVLNAFRNAVIAARKDIGITDWCKLDIPCTLEVIHMAAGTLPQQFEI